MQILGTEISDYDTKLRQQGASCDSAAQTALRKPCLLSFTKNNIGFYHSTNPHNEDAEDESETISCYICMCKNSVCFEVYITENVLQQQVCCACAQMHMLT